MGAQDNKVDFGPWSRCLWDSQATWSTAAGAVVLGLENALREGKIRGSYLRCQTTERLCLSEARAKSGSMGARGDTLHEEYLHLGSTRGKGGFKMVREEQSSSSQKENQKKK